jgi:hypothetical protein
VRESVECRSYARCQSLMDLHRHLLAARGPTSRASPTPLACEAELTSLALLTLKPAQTN